MIATHSTTRAKSQLTRWLALSMVAGQILFTLAWFGLAFVSQGFTIFGHVIAPYSAISAPLSGLGLGETAPYMNSAFIIGGILVLVGSYGIFQGIPEIPADWRWASIFICGLSGVGMIIDGVFTIETFMPHMLGYLLGTGMPVIGFLIAGLQLRKLSAWRSMGTWLIAASPITLALLILSLVTFDQEAVMAGRGIAGLTERILCVELAAVFSTLGWKVFHWS